MRLSTCGGNTRARALLLFSVLFLLCSDYPLAHAQTSTQKRPLVGAIRWDAWCGNRETACQAVQKSLGPEHWHYRLPFFSQVISSSQVFIDGASQAVVDQEITYANRAGIDYWAFVTYNAESALSLSLKYYLSSSDKQKIRFCSITELIRWGTVQDHSWAITRIIPLMKESTYLKVLDGRPLLYLGFIDDQIVAQNWGNLAALRQGVDDFRSAVRAAGAGNPYIVIMDVNPARARSLAQQLGGDAISSYVPGGLNTAQGAPYSALVSATESFWESSKVTGSQVIPIVMSGWDRRPRVENPVPWEPQQQPGVGIQYYYEAPRPSELANHLRHALTWVSSQPASDEANAVLIYAWNENDEGGWLVPTLSEGTARLDAIQDVLIAISAVVNGASFAPGAAVAPGSIASVFGSALASSASGTSLRMNGIAASLFDIFPTQINFQVPWELSGQSRALITISAGSVVSTPASVDIAPFAPGIFTVPSTLPQNSAGNPQGAILIATTGEIAALNGFIPGARARPANHDEFLTIYCTGLGPVSNQPATGAKASENPLSVTVTTPTVSIGGRRATVAFSGLAPGFIGLYQVNVQVPSDPALIGGAVPLVLSIGGATSNTVTIAVE